MTASGSSRRTSRPTGGGDPRPGRHGRHGSPVAGTWQTRWPWRELGDTTAHNSNFLLLNEVGGNPYFNRSTEDTTAKQQPTHTTTIPDLYPHPWRMYIGSCCFAVVSGQSLDFQGPRSDFPTANTTAHNSNRARGCGARGGPPVDRRGTQNSEHQFASSPAAHGIRSWGQGHRVCAGCVIFLQKTYSS
jgi:hypothetical protein